MNLFFGEVLEETNLTHAAVRTRNVILGVMFVVTLFAMAYVFIGIDRELDRSSSVNSDNVTWTLSQVEVDSLKLQRAVTLAAETPTDPAALDELRLAFDIFYSRFNILARSDQMAELPINSQLREQLWAPGAFFERVTPLIDGDDATLSAALPGLLQDMEQVTAEVRANVVTSLQSLMTASDRRRTELRRSLQLFASAAVGLLGLMAGLSLVIIQQNRAQQRRSETTARAVHNLRATIESSLDAVVIAGVKGQIIGCNRAADALFGNKRGDTRGKRFADLVSVTGFDDPLSMLHSRLQQEENGAELKDGRIQMTVRRADGTDVPVEVALAEAKGASGEPMFIAFIRDISERIEREQSLQRARNDALKGEEAKSRFLAVMSHEMRTPLNGLIAATELMQSSTDLDQRQSWLSEIVLSCGWAALDQVNNVLELTRLGSDQSASYQAVDFSPVQVIRDLMLQNQPHAGKRGNELYFEEPKHPVPLVSAPRQLFLRVLYNLIGNAIKFTDAGKVTVRLTLAPVDSGAQVQITISVIDTGIGIAEQDLVRIFHNFETLDASYARMREGTGLGLGIAKLSAEAMGGQISVASKLGQGSTFTFTATLPVAHASTAPANSPTAPEKDQVAALNILVAEDNPINSLLLAEMLRLRGHQVTTTVDGLEAVEKARDTTYDMILMDISMPRMDGLDATRTIRAAGASQHVPIIAVTANASPDKLPEFLGAGMTDVLVKPITRASLMSIIAAHANGCETTPKAADQRHAAPLILNIEVFDETVEEMGRDFVEGIALSVLQDVEALIVQLRDLAAAGSLAEAGRAAHKTAGAAAAIGLAGLQSALGAYEQAAVAGDAAAADQALTRAIDLLPQTVAALADQGLSIGPSKKAAE